MSGMSELVELDGIAGIGESAPARDEAPAPHWPPSGKTIAALLPRIANGRGRASARVAWMLQVSPRTVMRWWQRGEAPSSIPYSSYLLLSIAAGTVPAAAAANALPGGALERASSDDALARAANAALGRARDWRPDPRLVRALVFGYDARERRPPGRGVRACARALRVQERTVSRWCHSSPIPFAPWVILLARERALDARATVSARRRQPLGER